jgi:hypothetical protein
MKPDPLYVTAMRAGLPWLLSLMVVLATVLGGGVAVAHPCHAVAPTIAAPTIAAPTIATPATDAAPVAAAASQRHDAPCHCPNGRGDCHGHCLAMPAATLAIVESPLPDFFPGRLRVAFGDDETLRHWTPSTDIDPPRPSA